MKFSEYYNFPLTTYAQPPACIPEALNLLAEVEISKYPNVVDTIIELDDLRTSWDLLHAAIGLQGEALESIVEGHDVDTLPEEYGDVVYYLTIICVLLGITAEYIEICLEGSSEDLYFDVDGNDSTPEFFLLTSIEKVANLIKKVCCYGQPLEKHRNDLVVHIGNCFCAVKDITSLEEVLDANKKKLQDRYPSGTFSIEESEQRKDKTSS